MSLCDINDVYDYMGTLTAEQKANVATIHAFAEAYIARYCRRVLESTSYTLERYDGTGTNYLYLKAYPITSLYRLSIGTDDAITITNTSNNSSASASVTSTGVVLELNGTPNATCTFASYTTITTMVNAINAIGSSWSASVSSSTYASYASSLLLKRFGANCNDSNYVYLQIPDEPEDDFEVNENNGEIYLSSGFPVGKRNVFVTYTGGYSSSTCPSDLKYAIMSGTKYLFAQYENSSVGVERYTVGDIEYWFAKGGSAEKGKLQFPSEVNDILARYKRYLV